MPFVAKAVVLYRPETETLLGEVQEFAKAHQIELESVSVDRFLTDSASFLRNVSHVVLVANDIDVADVFAHAKSHDYTIGIVPVNSGSVVHKLYRIPRKLDEALNLAFSTETQTIDLLYCNDRVVMGMLMVGETPFLDRRSKSYLADNPRLMSRLWRGLLLLVMSLRNLFSIRHFPVTLRTAKDTQIRTSITGIVVIESDTDLAAARLVNQSVSVQDGKVSVLLISPKSISEYLHFLLLALFRQDRPGKRLPGAVSYIKTGSLTLESQKPLTYFLDGRKFESDRLNLTVCPKAVRINLNQEYQDLHVAQEESKDTIKIDNLPTHSERLAMIARRLPFFSHALEEDFKELFLLLKDNAQVKADYFWLMFLSAILASLGMFLDSAAVIIGAMVLAPLMAPIVSLSMAILRNDRFLLQNSLITILIGIAIALATAALVSLVIPLQKMTSEITARLQPSLLDLGVAVASGVAGGLAHARESIMKSLPGVAIAVALVPPLCVAGIGIGWLDLQIVTGAMLLFMTNLVGIALAAATTFMVLGFAPINRPIQGIRGIMLSLILFFIVSVPLYLSFDKIYQHWLVESWLSKESFVVNDKRLSLHDVEVKLQRDGVRVHATAFSAVPLERSDVLTLKQQLQDAWQQPVTLVIAYRLEL